MSGPTTTNPQAVRTNVGNCIVVAILTVVPLGACDSLMSSELSGDSVMEVTGVDPDRGAQGDTLDVRISGVGFTEDAVVTWERDGAPAEQIFVDEVVFVDQTELVASIRIGSVAEPGLHDVSVSRKRKKGVGSEDIVAVGEEIFEVYTPTALGQLADPSHEGVTGTRGKAISDNGIVAAVHGGYGSNVTAVRWSEADGWARIDDAPSYAYDVNSHGWIVGVHDMKGTYANVDAFLYRDDQVITLPTLVEGNPTNASAINDDGVIVGTTYPDYDWEHRRWGPPAPVVWAPGPDGGYGIPEELPGSVGAVNDVNARGDVVGFLGRYLLTSVIWRVRPDGAYEDPITLGDGDGVTAHALGLNDSGWVVGFIRHEDRRTEAVVWHPDDYSNPIVLDQQWSEGGAAYDINDAGQVVGVRYYAPDAPYQHGTLWQLDTTGHTTSLIRLAPADGYSRAVAAAINEDGWVIGHSSRDVDFVREHEATLWRPDR